MVEAGDLPLHCPGPKTPLWNSHPRVFLPIEMTNKNAFDHIFRAENIIDSILTAHQSEIVSDDIFFPLDVL